MTFGAFLQSFIPLTLLIAVSSSTALSARDAAQAQYYELRVYTTQSGAQQKRISDYWEKAAVPAYNRLGVAPIAVFTETHKEHWKGFGSAPVWKKLSGDPSYKDNVSKINNVFLKRRPASQI